MTWLQVVVLAIVQGLSEFLPISSSGHLVLVPSAAGWADQGLAFDVAVHFGSLLAVCLFFRDDIVALLRGAKYLMQADFQTLEGRMAVALGIGTVPAAVAGLALAGWIEASLRSPAVIVFTLSGYAIIMVLAGLQLMQFGWDSYLPMLNIPESFRTLAITLCGALIVLHAGSRGIIRLATFAQWTPYPEMQES